MVVNYANGKIYKIWSVIGDKIYVGSTTLTLSQRMADHRKDYKKWNDNKGHNVTSFQLFDLYGIDNCQIELIETVVALTLNDLHKVEGKHIRQLDCVNKNIPGRTSSEYKKDNREKILVDKKHIERLINKK